MLQLSQIFLSEGKLELSEEDGLIWKTVLRTGEWAAAPTPDGKPLVVVRDGASDTKQNLISLSEIVEAFNDGAFEHVTVPLATNVMEGDHADIARNNTGFIKALKIVDEGGISKLKAGFEFTEPDIKERVERGTIPNTSVGIVYDFVRKSDAKKYATALSHVALTHRPVIDQMEPFGIAASDDGKTEVTSFTPVEPNEDEWKDSESYEFIKTKVQSALDETFGNAYKVSNIMPGKIKVSLDQGGLEWQTSYTIDGDKAVLPPITEWLITDTKKIEAEVEPQPEPESEPIIEEAPIFDPENLMEAHALREERFSQGTNSNGGLKMSEINLNGLNLSDLPEDARAAVEGILNRNKELEREKREESVEAKIKEWGELGLSDAPGFLKLARRLMLSDDGATAGIMLADSENPREEKVTITEVVEQLVNALPKSDEGKIELSAQVDLGNGNHERPSDTDDKPLEERLKEARQALGKPVE